MDASLNECPTCTETLDTYVDKIFEKYFIAGDCPQCPFIGHFDLEEGEWIDSEISSSNKTGKNFVSGRIINKMVIQNVHGNNEEFEIVTKKL